MKSTKPHILLVGCGHMGGALLDGWMAAHIDADLCVLEPHDLPQWFQAIHHIKSVADLKTSQAPDAVLLAVKPQILQAVCADLRPYLPATTLIISIAAGQTMRAIGEWFDPAQPVIRAMPNTPAAVGKGVSVLIANPHVDEKQKSLAEILFRTAGIVEWIGDEDLLNAVTALSGSGPAYVFYLIEALAEAGSKSGLDAALAMRLARQTVIGAAALADHAHETVTQELRRQVTSPGGTTEAALKILMKGELQALMTQAIAAAKKRGEELSV